MRNVYVTLDGEKFNLNDLSRPERKIYKKVRKFLTKSPEPRWGDQFPNFWTTQLVQLYGGEQQALGTVLFKICQDLESRLGIKQGYILPPQEYDWLWEDLGIADKGKLVFLFYAILEAQGISYLTEVRVQNYVVLLNLMQILRFYGYPFRNRPEVHSDDLERDLEDLVLTGYLRESAEGLRIARRGKAWIRRKISAIPGYEILVEAVRKKIEELAPLSDWELLGLVLEKHTN